MGLYNKLSRIKNALICAKQIYQHGGITKVNIATPRYDKILQGKTALITGGSSGIGFEIARKCAQTGAMVIITGRNENKLKQAAKTLGEECCKYLVWDISKNASIDQKLQECKELVSGDIDILVNNAGIPPSKFFGSIDETEWNKIYDINLKGNFFLTQALVNMWKKTAFEGYKKILNISSQGGFVGATYPYRMAKWDVRGLTEGLGKLLIKDNIIVNGIAPGVVKTSMQQFSLEQGDNLYTDQNPVNRVCLPEEIAELALFLVSDACNFIVGQTIVCDGGYILK